MASSPQKDGRALGEAEGERPRRLMVIFNPTAGGAKARRLRLTLDHLRERGCSLDLRRTARKGDAEAVASGADPDAVDVVVAAGGDGTINEVINGLARSPGWRTGCIPAIGFLPLGTANVLALEMGLGTRPSHIADVLAGGQCHAVSLAKLDGRYFLLMGGAGFDAQVVANLRLGLKRVGGKLGYVWEMLVQAFTYDFPTLHVTVDGIEHEAATAVVCNGRLYGGPFVLVPDGDLTAADLNVVLLQRKGLLNTARYAAALVLGRLPRLPDVRVLHCTSEVRIDGPSGAPLQADGDIFCRLPVTFRPSPRAINLIFPAS